MDGVGGMRVCPPSDLDLDLRKLSPPCKCERGHREYFESVDCVAESSYRNNLNRMRTMGKRRRQKCIGEYICLCQVKLMKSGTRVMRLGNVSQI